MARLLSLMEDVASQIGGLSSTAGAGTSRLARWVAKEDDDAVYLKVPMPGLTKEHVEVRADKNILVIKGEGERSSPGTATTTPRCRGTTAASRCPLLTRTRWTRSRPR
uniref:SHSP domain-containing protein n=1 Tax=Aegilops tauschii subsp. strangulata TaxID=200361 RepID=A0A453R4W6_AEGTS